MTDLMFFSPFPGIYLFNALHLTKAASQRDLKKYETRKKSNNKNMTERMNTATYCNFIEKI